MINCQFEDRGKANLRHITVNAIVLKNNKVLLGKRGTYNKGKPLLEAGKWALLGGFFNRDEYLEEAVKREVFEESGWKIDNLRLFCINDNPNRPAEDRQNVDIIFLADAVEQIKKNDEEVRELKWFEITNLPDEKSIAFDHGKHLTAYQKFLVKSFPLPLWRRSKSK